MVGFVSVDEGDVIVVWGFWSNVIDYYVDGICVQGNFILELEIEQLQVIIGGIEVQYGDVIGGIILIIIKGLFN